MNQRIHRDDMIEAAARGMEHVADGERDMTAAEIPGSSLLRQIDEGR